MGLVSIHSLWLQAIKQLKMHEIETPEFDARMIAQHVLACSHTQFLSLWRSPFPSTAMALKFNHMISKRCQHKPLAYLLESTYFCNRIYHITEGVLIPRPETEGLIQAIQVLLDSTPLTHVYECGFGSGILSIELALRYPKLDISAWDTNPKAMNIAQKNAAHHGAHHINWAHADFFHAISTPLTATHATACIVSNPPYIPSQDILRLEIGVQNFEPHCALDGGPDGLAYYRKLMALSAQFSCPLCCEIGIQQSKPLRHYAQKIGLPEPIFISDSQGIPRIMLIRS